MTDTPTSMMRLEATEAIRSFNKLLAEFSSQHEQALATMQQSAAQRSRQSRGQIETLLASEGVLRERVGAQNREAALESQKLAALEKEVHSLQQTAAALPREVQETQKEAASKAQQVDEKKKGVDKIAREKEYALKELSKGVSYFETHLGLRIEALSDGTLKFSFKYIDDKNPERVCHFRVHVNQKSQYEVGVCEPSVADVSGLCARLNDDNDFSAFVQSMRRAFRKHCNAGAGTAVFM